jgi:hypothetical protein
LHRHIKTCTHHFLVGGTGVEDMDLHEDEGTLTYHYTTVLTLESPDEMMDVEVTGQAEEATERLLELPLSLDPLYNLIVCSHCCVALPWEWVGSHLTISSSPETLWGLTNMVTQGDANYVAPICVTIFAVPRPLLQSSKGPNGDAKFPNHVVRKNKTGERVRRYHCQLFNKRMTCIARM